MDFAPENYLPEDTEARLRAWDTNPELGPAMLTEQPAKRLGHYFERLYECLLGDLLGWEILLKNQPVRNNGITLGELDFIVRNPGDGTIEHHEIAVKFYLGYCDTDQREPLWYGPNARDRLDLKTRRLTDHQSQLTKRKEARILLQSRGIETPVRPRIFMPGYLFYQPGAQLQPPEGVAPDHLRGEWLYIDELGGSGTAGAVDTQHWVPLMKPHWLGSWRQQERPNQQDAEEALEMVRSRGIPRLFAALAPCPTTGTWRETARLFVMPRAWPG